LKSEPFVIPAVTYDPMSAFYRLGCPVENESINLTLQYSPCPGCRVGRYRFRL